MGEIYTYSNKYISMIKKDFHELAKSGKTERQFRFIGSPFRFSGTLDYN